MTTSSHSIRPTPFPRLDTLSADLPHAHSEHIEQRTYQSRQYSYACNAATRPKGKTALLQDFSRFIASFTGEVDVCYQLALRTSSVITPEIVQATVVGDVNDAVSDDGRAKEVVLDVGSCSTNEREFGFGFEVLVDPEVFDTTNLAPVLHTPFIVQYHATQLSLVMHHDTTYINDAFAEVAWHVLIDRLSSKVNDTPSSRNHASVLNHPPLTHPPPLAQFGKGTLPVGLLHAGFQRSAARCPERTALHFQSSNSHGPPVDEIFTYAQLDDLTTALAFRLRETIAAPPEGPMVVPAYMSNSAAFYISWLAVLKAGFAFCPLTVDAPPEQLRGIVEEVGASLVLTNGLHVGGRPWDAWYCDDDELATCLDVNEFVATVRYDQGTRHQCLPEVQETDLAYVMYTSGSTGKPKGVKIHHHAAACSIGSHCKHIPASFFKDGFRWFQFAAPTFDPSIMEIFTTWWTGGTLCGAPRDVLLTDPERAINRLSATIMMATPSMASVLRPENVPTLRHLWTMGEKLTPKVIRDFSYDSPGNSSVSSHAPRLQIARRLLNAYGPTEGSINCNIVANFSHDERGSIIGQPVDTCSILIIDPDRRQAVPVPLGFAGELAIGGPQVSQGYLNRPEQTAAAFATSSTYGRLYRTGDRARVVKTTSGELTVEFLGRLTSDQVKLSGRRVELGQIESVIASVPGVTDAVATVHQHGAVGQGSEQIVVCMVTEGAKSKDEMIEDAHKAAEKSLAQFMRPTRYFVLPSMPRSRSGKTDRRALVSIVTEQWDTTSNGSRRSSDSGYDTGLAQSIADNAMLSLVVDIIVDVCDVNATQINPSTQLLSLGLDSLRAVRLLQQLRDRGILHLNVARVACSKTVSGLANSCVASDSSHAASTVDHIDWSLRLADFNKRHLDPCAGLLKLPATDIERVLPTTATQSGMIASFLRSISRQSASSARKSYINHSIYHKAVDIDAVKLHQAWHTALTRADILRAVFTSVDDELSPFAQCILSPKSSFATVEIHQYTCEFSPDWEATIEQAQVDAEAAIALERPPFRISVIHSTQKTSYILSLFHGVFDGGSLELILRDVEDAYFDQKLQPRAQINVAVQRHFSEATDQSVNHWRSVFKDFEPVPFPCVSASKPETQAPDAQVTEVIGNITLSKLSLASKAASVSALSILQAAWATVLFAYTGSTTDVSFGSVVSDRMADDLSSCAAPTFAVVPSRIRHQVSTTPSAREVLSDLTSKNADALPYHHLPLGSLTTAEGTLPYDTLLAFQAFDTSSSKDSLWTSVDYPAMEHDFAVMIEVWPTASGSLRLRGTYTHNHLDRPAAETMLRQLDSVIAFLCDNTDRPFHDARFAVDAQLQSRLPMALSSAQQSSESELFLHEAFSQHAIANPDATALLFKQSIDGTLPDIKWSYGELYAMAKSFATRLLGDFGPLKNEPVMICMEKCAELYVAVLGVLLAGAGWCPIDPYSPPARQRLIMERTGSRLLVTSPIASNVAADAVPEDVCQIEVDLETLGSAPTDGNHDELPGERHPDDLAYLIFTSGTTGLPKGVPITHKSAATAMNALAEVIPSDVKGGEVRCMQFSQYTFDVFVQDLFYTWKLGGTVISSTRQLMIQNFADLANNTEATHAHLTPAFSATLARSNIKTLEVVTMIGEKLTESVAADWGTDMRAFNTYGPAEVTVVSTLRQFTGKHDPYHSSNVGIPLPSVGTYVLDSSNNVVMRGAIGELALSGPQLSPGYWQLPEVNAKKFIWSDEMQEKLYLTGDLVRHLADGTLNFVGRNDDLVKLGGIRVELGEIAFALKDADSRIEKFEVLHCKRKDADEKLVVAFMACPSLTESSDAVEAIASPAARDLAHIAREYGRKVLPPYMLPATFVVMPRIPRTASAKVDRATMTAVYHTLDLATWDGAVVEGTVDENDQHKSWREAHQDLLQVIADGLRVTPQSLHPVSSLPAIGIDSIGAIRLIPKINALGHQLSVVDAFKCRTLADLCELASASVIRSYDSGEPHPDCVLERFDTRYYGAASAYLEQDDIKVIPTTVLQEGLLSESFKDENAYWSSHLFALEAEVDLVKLKRAWTKIARQTEALRAGFVAKAMLPISSDARSADNLSYLQVIYEEPKVGWTEHKSVDSIEGAARLRVAEVAQYHHQQLFKLPPWAIDIFHTQDGTSKMMITIHHSIYDGPSLSFLEKDVQAAYQRGYKIQPRLQLTEAVASQSALDVDSDDTADFWKETLQDLHAGPEEQTAAEEGTAELQHRIQYLRGSTTFSDLRTTARKLGLISVVTIFRAAWALVLGDLLETAHVLFAEILSDRIVDSKLEDVVGPMMSTVPSLFARKDTIAATLTEHDTFAKRAWQHRNIRPGTIRALLKCGPSAKVYPAMFAFHPAAPEESGESQKLWQRLPDVTQIEVEHPYAFNIWQDAKDTPQFELAVADHLMTEDEQHLLLRQLDALINAMTKSPDVPVATLTENMSRELLSITTPRVDTKCPSPYGPTYYVEHFAETHPDWKGAEIALKIDYDETLTESWTYAELNDQSNRIAHWILQHGVSNRTIGMCLGRTLTSYAVLLGIMKSGNCYLPIDEGLPADRKSYLLEDSSATMVFATRDVFEGVNFPEARRLVDPENDRFQQSLAILSAKNPDIVADARDNCYLLYTSGSTGKPKGVLVNRGNLASFVEAQSEFICDVTTTKEEAGRGKYMCLASRAFDVHLGEAFLAWRHGLTALTAPRSTLLDDLALALSSLHITHASFVPSLLDQTGLTPEDAPDLVFLGVGGEKMSPKTKKLWGGHGRVGLINAYGPTEATIGCCSNRLFPDSNTNDIGIPLGDSQAHVLIPGTDHYALRGMPGELCFTGSLIANGYLNRPEAKGFVEDFHGQRMYRTGDIVKLDIEDHVYFLGRKDDQVKIRGQRVELGEVAEGVRTASEDPIDVAALVVKHPELSRVQLVAFIAQSKASTSKTHDVPEIVHAQLQNTNSSLRAACQKTLPSSTVPDLIIPLTYIPLAATSGKADNKTLTQIFSSTLINDLMPRTSTSHGRDAVERAMTEAETTIFEIVASVLKDEPHFVTPDSTLFELGIDSLSGISVFSKLRAAGYDCSVGMVMKNPTLEQLAQTGKHQTTDKNDRIEDVRRKLSETEKAFMDSSEVGIRIKDIAAVRPCLPLQEVLVAESMHQSLDGSDGAYVNHRRFELGHGLDIDRLQASWARLIYANEILRTCFAMQNDNFLQVVLKPEACEMDWTDVRLDHVSDIGDFQHQLGRDIVSRLSTTPPIRLRVIHLSDDKSVLLLSIHHALYDGNSLEMMMHDARSFYEGSLPRPRPSVVPFIEYLAEQDQARQRDHWTTLLHNWQNAPLLGESAVKFVTLQTSERQFSRTLSDLEGQVTKLNVTFATLLQFAFATAMAQSKQITDFIYGNVLSGRAVPVKDVDQMMAPCITTIPQRIKLDDAQARVIEALAALQDANSTSLEYQHVSPRHIQKWTGADRALYDCLFSFVRLEASSVSPSKFLKEQGSDIGVDYPLAVEFEADPTVDKLIVRAGFTEAFGANGAADLLLEKIEILTDVVLQQSDLTIGSLGLPAGEATIMSKKDDTYDESTWSPLEDRVRSLISQYTSVPEQDIHKDTAFIHMGIDSISAIRFAKHLRCQGLKVSSADVIRHNRLGGLCKHLSSSLEQPAMKEEGPLVNSSNDDLAAVLATRGVTGMESAIQCYECTPLQSGMLAQSLATDGALYMHHHATRCEAEIDFERLKLAWRSLVADLDILRTTFHYIPDHTIPWMAVVRDVESTSWEAVEVADAREYWLRLSEKSDFIQRIESSTPLASVHVVRSKQNPVLILTLHHAVYDGISLAMLYRHLALRYHGIQTPPITPFYEAAKAIARHRKAATDFWADQVRAYAGAPSFEAPEEPTYILAERTVTEDMPTLEEQCRRADLDIKDICVAAFGKAMACLYGRRDVVFGQVMAARHGVAGDDNEVIGPMFNTIPFRVAIKDQLMTNFQVVNEIHATHSDSLDLQHAPLGEVQKQWRATASDPSAQLIDSIFVYSKMEKQASQGLELFGQPLEADKSPVPSEYRLNFEVEHTEDGLVARALSSMSHKELDTLLDHFKGAVEDIVSQPARFATAYPDQLRKLPAEAEPETISTSSFDKGAVDSFADLIRTAMSEVVQVPADNIELDSSIYIFGIDSIAAIQIVSRCKKVGVRVSVADILKGAVLGRICEIVQNRSKEKTNSMSVENETAELVTSHEVEAAITSLSLSSDAVEDVLPCLPGQQYHLISWLQSGRTLYEPGWCYRSTLGLDIDRLKAAWNTLRQRNAALRTTFAAVGPYRALQVVLKPDAVKDNAFMAHEDHSGTPLQNVVRDRARVEARSPTDFFSLPVRLRLIKTAGGDAVMIYIHHSLYDAWSMPRLVSELASIYDGVECEQGPPFAQLVRHTLASTDKAEERKFWRQSMAGREKAIIPSALPPADELDRRQSFAMVEGSKASVAELERLCFAHNISPHHVVLVAFARALARITDTSSPLFGFFQLGRSAAFDNIDKVTGPCVNTLPLGLISVLTRDVLVLARELQQLLSARVPFEQSGLHTALEAFDPTARQLPFNTHINLLWHKSSLIGSVAEGDLFKPLAIGVPTDYSSPRALPGPTAVDLLDTSLLPAHQLFIDVGPGETGIVFGARADATLMDAAGIKDFVGGIENEVIACMEALRG